MKRARLPYCELVEPGFHAKPFRIVEGDEYSGSIDLVKRKLCVPGHADARYVVRHECGHARFSPPKTPKLDFPRSYLLAVEDARVNLGLARLGTPVVATQAATDHAVELLREDLERGDLGLVILRCVASIGTGARGSLVLAAQAGHEQVGNLARCAARTVCEGLLADAVENGTPEARFERGVELARDLWRLLSASGTPAPQELDRCLGVHAVPGAGDGDESAGGVRPGTMKVVHAPAAKPHVPRRLACAPDRYVEEGTVVRAPHRWYLDGRIFRRRSRRGAGTVLVDVSGSMSLTGDDVDQLLNEAGQALTVALYSGRKKKGELRLVVYEGRRAADEHLRPYGRGNVIDLPALEWLAEQPGPRIWLSDGGVTGVNDQGSRELRQSCFRLCREHRIARVENIAAVVKALAARG